jgi:hypothetical protein
MPKDYVIQHVDWPMYAVAMENNFINAIKPRLTIPI